ncbi:MAG: AraC family transcriptional regulator [Clostridia bacterium]|nr:AraC family transcriptional regulator [Clostridia bacterium]
MLKTTEVSVTDIAKELGFCDTCFFVKQFRKAVGITPGAFRKMDK